MSSLDLSILDGLPAFESCPDLDDIDFITELPPVKTGNASDRAEHALVRDTHGRRARRHGGKTCRY